MTGVYKITNPFNQAYIGQSIDIKKRFESHKSCSFSNWHLSKSIHKHGVENHTFEILEECLPKDLMDRERFYLSHYKKELVLFNYSIYLLLGDDIKLAIDEPDFLINKIEESRAEKELRKHKFLNRKVSLVIKLNKIMKDELGNDFCKQIAEDAVNKEYEKLLKKQGK